MDGGRARNRGLDVLRAVAIVMVMIWHAPKVSGVPVFGRVGDFGLWGVDLFFVLSGYLIGHQLFSGLSKTGKIDFRRFYLRRLLRTLPNYWVVLGLYALWPGFRELPNMPELWRFLTFTQNFHLNFSAFSHAWSLCVEEQFYLILPLICFLMRGRVSRGAVVGWIFGLVLAGMILRGWLWMKFVSPDPAVSVVQYFSKIYYPTWSRLDGLVFGVSIALTRNYCPQGWLAVIEKGNGLLAAGAVSLLLGFHLQSHRLDFYPSIFGYPLVSGGFALIVMAALSPKSYLSRLRVPGAHWIAVLAYSIYLLHKPIFRLTDMWLTRYGIPNTSPFAIVLSVAMSLIGAATLYVCVERPFLKLRERIL